MEVSHVIQDDQECSKEGATFEVCVIEENDEYSETNVKKGTTKKWVYSGPARRVANVFLNLDMGKTSLEFCLAGKFCLPVFAEGVSREGRFGVSVFLGKLSTLQSNILQNKFIGLSQ